MGGRVPLGIEEGVARLTAAHAAIARECPEPGGTDAAGEGLVDREPWAALVELLEGDPLAIELAARHLAVDPRPIEYAERFRRAQQLPEYPFATAVRVAVSSLPTAPRSLLRVLAHLAQAPIPLEFALAAACAAAPTLHVRAPSLRTVGRWTAPLVRRGLVRAWGTSLVVPGPFRRLEQLRATADGSAEGCTVIALRAAAIWLASGARGGGEVHARHAAERAPRWASGWQMVAAEAAILGSAGGPVDARGERLLREVLAHRSERAPVGPVLLAKRELARVLHGRGAYEEAGALLREVVSIEQGIGPSHPTLDHLERTIASESTHPRRWDPIPIPLEAADDGVESLLRFDR